MAPTDPGELSPSARKTALLVSRITFYVGLMLGIALGGGAITILTKNPPLFPEPMERYLVAAVFIGLSIMSFGFAAMAKSRIGKLNKP